LLLYTIYAAVGGAAAAAVFAATSCCCFHRVLQPSYSVLPLSLKQSFILQLLPSDVSMLKRQLEAKTIKSDSSKRKVIT
jgi:hypothetical protein